MIDLQNGDITFFGKVIELSPFHEKADFISLFPQDSIEKIRDMGNGYVWYDLHERLYSNDYSVPIWLCFNANGDLEFIHIYPQCFDNTQKRMWADWTNNEADQDKKYCSNWLKKYCGLENSRNIFSWGELSVFYDPRSCSCGISIHYAK